MTKNKPRFLSVLAVMALLCAAAVPAAAAEASASAEPVSIRLNGTLLTGPDTEGRLLSGGYTMVSVRLADRLPGLSVTLSGDAQEASVTDGTAVLRFTADAPEAVFRQDGTTETAISLGCACFRSGDTLYVPVRVLAASFGMQVGWSGAYRTVQIDTSSLSEEDRSVLSALSVTDAYSAAREICRTGNAKCNLREYALRNYVNHSSFCAAFVNTDGETVRYDAASGSIADKADYLLAEITARTEARCGSAWGIRVEFRTDRTFLYAAPNTEDPLWICDGMLSMTPTDETQLACYQAMHPDNPVIQSLRVGCTVTVPLEQVVLLNTAGETAHAVILASYNRTSGGRTAWT